MGSEAPARRLSMHSLTISLIVFACVFAGALLGLLLRPRLPQHHVGGDSKDALRLGMGLVGTMAALLLSLLVASAKSSYDAQGAQLTQMAATVGLLDRALVVYGPEAKEERELLRATVIRMLDQMWSRDGAESSTSAPTTAGGEGLYTRIQNLSPATDRQRKVQDQALGFATDVGRMRWLMYEQATVTISTPLLVALIVWLTISFVSFGLTSPCNATVLTGFFLSVLSVSSAIFLILEMYSPYTGLLQISRAPLQAALLHLGR